MRHPSEAERLVDFINTFDLRRPDRREPPFAPDDALDTPGALDRWLAANGLADGSTADQDDLVLARRLRTALRGLLWPDGVVEPSVDALDAVADELPLVVRIRPGPRSVAVPPGTGSRGALTVLLRDVLLLGASGDLGRLKACAADDCRWAFVDRSRPRVRRWCSSIACGNRDKTRRYRGRRRRTTGAARRD
jgi:predicted RNA-binding Zn ribbon-like protein